MRVIAQGGVASAEITNLPGSSQIAVIHDAFVSPKSRGKGAGSKAHQERLALLHRSLYDAAICTCDETNVSQVKILVRNGWKCVSTFQSRKTDHRVGIWVKIF